MKLIKQVTFLLGLSSLVACNTNNSSTEVPAISETKEIGDKNKIPSPFTKKLSMGDISFDVHARNTGIKNNLTITPSGLTVGDAPAIYELTGMVTDAKVADMNGDDWPEVLVFAQLSTQNKQAFAAVYSVTDGKSMSEVYFPNVTTDTEYGLGFRGGGELALAGKYLIHLFPIYNTDDTNGTPTGGTRQIQYQMVENGAVRAFEVVSVTNTPPK